MNAEIDYLGKEGYPPLRIRGRKLQGGEVFIDTSLSSQFTSALLLIGPCLPGGLFVRMPSMIADVVDADELETHQRRQRIALQTGSVSDLQDGDVQAVFMSQPGNDITVATVIADTTQHGNPFGLGPGIA